MNPQDVRPTQDSSSAPLKTRGPHDAQGVASEALDAVIQQVAADSRLQPRKYLDDTIVPHGGE